MKGKKPLTGAPEEKPELFLVHRVNGRMVVNMLFREWRGKTREASRHVHTFLSFVMRSLLLSFSLKRGADAYGSTHSLPCQQHPITLARR